MLDLTPAQRRVYAYCRDHLQREQRLPTVREVCVAFGWSNPNAATCHLKALRRKGWLAYGVGDGGKLKLTGVTVTVADARDAAVAGLNAAVEELAT